VCNPRWVASDHARFRSPRNESSILLCEGCVCAPEQYVLQSTKKAPNFGELRKVEIQLPRMTKRRSSQNSTKAKFVHTVSQDPTTHREREHGKGERVPARMGQVRRSRTSPLRYTDGCKASSALRLTRKRVRRFYCPKRVLGRREMPYVSLSGRGSYGRARLRCKPSVMKWRSKARHRPDRIRTPEGGMQYRRVLCFLCTSLAGT
jgi:hypothetical protein